MSKAYDPKVMTWAALIAIVVAFVGKVGGFLPFLHRSWHYDSAVWYNCSGGFEYTD